MRLKTGIALVSTAAGLACAAGAVDQGLHYSGWANPGALGTAVHLLAAAIGCFAVPAAMIAVGFFKGLRREIRALGLTPVQAALVEAAAMGYAHHEWRAYNARESARLTESVMGRERDWQ